jgi:hypothetical protein
VLTSLRFGPVSALEAQHLIKITRSTKDQVRLRRAGVVLAWMQGRPAGDITAMFAATGLRQESRSSGTEPQLA